MMSYSDRLCAASWTIQKLLLMHLRSWPLSVFQINRILLKNVRPLTSSAERIHPLPHSSQSQRKLRYWKKLPNQAGTNFLGRGSLTVRLQSRDTPQATTKTRCLTGSKSLIGAWPAEKSKESPS